MKKVLILSNTLRATMSFRIPLLKWLLGQQCNVYVVLFDDDNKDELMTIVSNVYEVNIKNSSLSPRKMLIASKQLKKIMSQINPDLILTFMVMANILGPLSAPKNVPIISMVEGRGRVFQQEGTKWKLIRFIVSKLLRHSLRRCESVYFLNSDDRDLFIKLAIVVKNKTKLMNGIGVDLKKFSFTPISNFNRVVMVSRLYKTKGVFDFCEMASAVKKQRPDIEFLLVGPKGDISEKDLKPYLDSGAIRWTGPKKDIENVYKESTFSVLTSYGEGFPMTIMESCASGRPCIAYDVPGCRDAILNGVNGFLIKPKDVLGLVDRVLQLLSNKEQLMNLSVNSSKYAENHWSFQDAQKEYLDQISEIIKR